MSTLYILQLDIRRIGILAIFLVMVLILLSKTLMFYLEYRRRMGFSEIMNSWLISENNIDLCYSSRKIFYIKIILSFWISIIICRLLIWMTMILLLILSYIAYQFYEYSLIGLGLNFIIIFILFYPSFHLVVLGVYICYIMCRHRLNSKIN